MQIFDYYTSWLVDWSFYQGTVPDMPTPQWQTPMDVVFSLLFTILLKEGN